MKKTIFTFSLLFTLLSFRSPEKQFHLSISYKYLPSSISYRYEVTNEALVVFEKYYDSKIYSHRPRNINRFNKYDKERVIAFIESINWENIPRKLSTPTIDGYYFEVDLTWEDKVYEFYIDNTYHETFDSLLTISNEVIPKKKIRNKFKLYYEE